MRTAVPNTLLSRSNLPWSSSGPIVARDPRTWEIAGHHRRRFSAHRDRALERFRRQLVRTFAGRHPDRACAFRLLFSGGYLSDPESAPQFVARIFPSLGEDLVSELLRPI